MGKLLRAYRLTAGISLVESIVSVFLALTCGLLLFTMIPTSTMSKERAKTQNVATSIAQKHMEAIRTLGFSRLTPNQLASYNLIDNATAITGNKYSITSVDSSLVDSPVSSLPNGSGWISVESVSANLKHVTVHIDYTDVKGPMSVQLDTSIANY